MSLNFNKINIFVQNLGLAGHNLSTDQLAVALSDTAPTATVTSFANEISYANVSGSNPNYLTTTSWTNSSGTSKLLLASLTMTATGTVPQFRYIGIKDVTTSKVIAWFDYGSEINMQNGDSITITPDGTNGLIQIV